MKEYLEFDDGKSSKFWSIKVSGKTHTVTYGRQGTDGQSKTKNFATSSLAKSDAEKMVASKIKKGYLSTSTTKPGKKSNTRVVQKKKGAKGNTKKAVKTSARGEKKTIKSGLANPVFATLFVSWILIYQKNADILFFTLEDDEIDEMKAGVSLIDYQKDFRLHQYYNTERRRFRNKAAASQAVKRMLEQAQRSKFFPRVEKKLEFDAAINFQNPGVKFKQNFPRIGEIVERKNGPIEGRTFGVPKWIYPRPPMLCSCCGNPLVHVATFYGDLDPLLGKKSCVVVSACRFTENSECNAMVEVVFQRTDRKPASSFYYENTKAKQFLNFHISEQTDFDEKVHFSVAVHRGLQSQPGWVTWHPCKNLETAKATVNKMKRLHLTGEFKEAKKPEQNPKPDLYAALYESMSQPDVLGKPLKPSTWAAKRVSEGYEVETVNCSGEKPTNNNFYYEQEQLKVGGEPLNRERYKKVSANMKKWSLKPYVFFSHLKGMNSLCGVNNLEFEVWIDPNADFGRAIIVYEH